MQVKFPIIMAFSDYHEGENAARILSRATGHKVTATELPEHGETIKEFYRFRFSV